MEEVDLEYMNHDPIIQFYMKQTQSTEYETGKPVFSETTLRLAWKCVLGNKKPLDRHHLELYRRLLLFCYTEKYKNIDDLLEIMICFDEKQLRECFEDYAEIREKWHNFTDKYLKDVLCKQAFCDILCLWYKRYNIVFGDVSTVMLQTKAQEFQSYLTSDALIGKCLKNLDVKIKNKVKMEKNDDLKGITAFDLDIKKVLVDIMPKLNPLVWVYLKMPANEDMVPPREKKIKVEQVQVVNKISTSSASIDGCKSIEITLKDELAETQENEAASNLVEIDELDELDNSDIAISDQYFEIDESTESDVSQETNELIEIIENTDSTCKKTSEVITNETAMKYISALQAYAVNHGLFGAFGLLDTVDTIFRKKIHYCEDD